jgi:hypothetical protein
MVTGYTAQDIRDMQQAIKADHAALAVGVLGVLKAADTMLTTQEVTDMVGETRRWAVYQALMTFKRNGRVAYAMDHSYNDLWRYVA